MNESVAVEVPTTTVRTATEVQKLRAPAKPPRNPLSDYELAFVARTFAAREAKSLTQDKLAAQLCGVSRGTYKQYETRNPLPHHLSDDFLRETGVSWEYLFTGRRGPNCSLTTRQYARLLSDWLVSVGLDPHLFGTHSLRRTKATLIYRRTGNLRAVQLLLGHTKIESTVRYLGIEVDDALAIAEQVDV